MEGALAAHFDELADAVAGEHPFDLLLGERVAVGRADVRLQHDLGADRREDPFGR